MLTVGLSTFYRFSTEKVKAGGQVLMDAEKSGSD